MSSRRYGDQRSGSLDPGSLHLEQVGQQSESRFRIQVSLIDVEPAATVFRRHERVCRPVFPPRNLQQTLRLFHDAYNFVRDTVANGDTVLFVGTKRQAIGIVEEEATRCEMFYVTQRW